MIRTRESADSHPAMSGRFILRGCPGGASPRDNTVLTAAALRSAAQGCHLPGPGPGLAGGAQPVRGGAGAGSAAASSAAASSAAASSAAASSAAAAQTGASAASGIAGAASAASTAASAGVGAAAPLPLPEESSYGRASFRFGYQEAVEMRFVRGSFRERAPATAWARLLAPLLPGTAPAAAAGGRTRRLWQQDQRRARAVRLELPQPRSLAPPAQVPGGCVVLPGVGLPSGAGGLWNVPHNTARRLCTIRRGGTVAACHGRRGGRHGPAWHDPEQQRPTPQRRARHHAARHPARHHRARHRG